MGIFKKRKKETNETKPEEITNTKENKTSDVEILELDTKDAKQPIINNKKENRLILGILAILILFVFLLPTITSFISKNSIFTYNRVMKDVEESKTVDGMLEIGKDEGSITAKKIQFYNPTKKQNNEINIVYLPKAGIKNVEELNIYIEIYNVNKKIIYREPYSVKNVERKVQGNYILKLNETIYSEAAYVKIEVIDYEEINDKIDSLVCTNEYDKENYKIKETITYNFSEKGLINYQVNKDATISENKETTEEIPEEEIITPDINSSENIFKEEIEELNKANINDLEYDEKSLKYSVDVKTYKQGKSSYTKLYDLGSVKRQIKLTEESKKWSCN